MRGSPQKAEPVLCAQPFEQRQRLDAVIPCTADEAGAEFVGTIFHLAAGGDAASAPIAMNDVGEFVPSSQGKFVIAPCKREHSAGNGDVPIIAVRLDATIREQDETSGTVGDRTHDQRKGLPSTPHVHGEIATGLRACDFIQKSVRDQRRGLAPRDDLTDRQSANSQNLVALLQAGKLSRTVGRNAGDDGVLPHAKRGGQKGPVLLTVGPSIVEDDASIRRRAGTGAACRHPEAPFHPAETCEIGPQQNRPRSRTFIGDGRYYKGTGKQNGAGKPTEGPAPIVSHHAHRRNPDGTGKLAIPHCNITDCLLDRHAFISEHLPDHSSLSIKYLI